jgi:hypothetical protein
LCQRDSVGIGRGADPAALRLSAPLTAISAFRITQFPYPNLSEKFALLFWCFRLGEFLEARIIPERIEHRIEPEHRGRKHDANSK